MLTTISGAVHPAMRTSQGTPASAQRKKGGKAAEQDACADQFANGRLLGGMPWKSVDLDLNIGFCHRVVDHLLYISRIRCAVYRREGETAGHSGAT